MWALAWQRVTWRGAVAAVPNLALAVVFLVGVPLGVARVLRGAPTVSLTEDPWIGVWYFALLGLYELAGLHDARRELREAREVGEAARAELTRQAQR